MMDMGGITPTRRADPTSGAASPRLLFASPTPRRPSTSATATTGGAGADRYVAAAAARHDPSMARFLLTSNENTTPMIIRAVARHSSSREASVASSSVADVYSSPLLRHGGGGGANNGISRTTDGGRGQHSMTPGSPGTRRSYLAGGQRDSTRLTDTLEKMHLDPASHRDRDSGSGSPLHHGDGCSPDAVNFASPVDIEPYTSKLARTLFADVQQTTVLSVNNPYAVPPYSYTTHGSDGPACLDNDDDGEGEEEKPYGGTENAGRGDGAKKRCRGCSTESEASNGPPSPSGPTQHSSATTASTAMSAATRFQSSLGAIFHSNRTRHFKSSTFRVIPCTPERILDAADMVDDFYMNLIDWSATSNVLCVALQNMIYLWNGQTCSITQLQRPHSNSSAAESLATGVSWAPDGVHLAVGRNNGVVELWDTETQMVVLTYKQHSDRAVSLSWDFSGTLLASGSHDTTIGLHDVRTGGSYHRNAASPFQRGSSSSSHLSSSSFSATSVLRGHRAEVCGLKWSPTGTILASGGNDNQLLLWDRRQLSSSASSSSAYVHDEVQPMLCFNQHTAAVKALGWNPMQPSLLASGGGTDDRTLRFWNTLTGECVNHLKTRSQVCGLVWNRSGTELVSAHGYTDNQLTIWKYPSLRRVADLTGHTSRVLHLCLSANGEVVVSAAGDETLRFWKCFPATATCDSSAIASPSGSPPRAVDRNAARSPFPQGYSSQRCASVSRESDELFYCDDAISLR